MSIRMGTLLPPVLQIRRSRRDRCLSDRFVAEPGLSSNAVRRCQIFLWQQSLRAL